MPSQKLHAGGHGAVKGNAGSSDPSPTTVESWPRAGTGCRLLPAGAFSTDTVVTVLSLARVTLAACAGGFAAPRAAGRCLSHPFTWEGLASCSTSCSLFVAHPPARTAGPPRLPFTKQRPIPGIHSCLLLRIPAPLGVSQSLPVFWSRPWEPLDDSPSSPQALKAAQVLPSWGSHWAGMMETRHRHRAGHGGPVDLGDSQLCFHRSSSALTRYLTNSLSVIAVNLPSLDLERPDAAPVPATWGCQMLALGHGGLDPDTAKQDSPKIRQIKVVCIQGKSVLGEEQHHFPKVPSPSREHCWYHQPRISGWSREPGMGSDPSRVAVGAGCASSAPWVSAHGVA